MENSIHCPTCTHPIFFDVKGLLQGANFSCSQCDTIISLPQSAAHTTEKHLNELEQLKSSILNPEKESE